MNKGRNNPKRNHRPNHSLKEGMESVFGKPSYLTPVKYGKEGQDHINIYSKSSTELGRFLDPASGFNFSYPIIGTFRSITGMLYWLKDPMHNDLFRTITEQSLHKVPKALKSVRLDNYSVILMRATMIRLERRPDLIRLIKEMSEDIDLLSYYMVGDMRVRITTPMANMVVPALTEVLKAIREDREPAYDAFATKPGTPEHGFLEGVYAFQTEVQEPTKNAPIRRQAEGVKSKKSKRNRVRANSLIPKFTGRTTPFTEEELAKIKTMTQEIRTKKFNSVPTLAFKFHHLSNIAKVMKRSTCVGFVLDVCVPLNDHALRSIKTSRDYFEGAAIRAVAAEYSKEELMLIGQYYDMYPTHREKLYESDVNTTTEGNVVSIDAGGKKYDVTLSEGDTAQNYPEFRFDKKSNDTLKAMEAPEASMTLEYINNAIRHAKAGSPEHTAMVAFAAKLKEIIGDAPDVEERQAEVVEAPAGEAVIEAKKDVGEVVTDLAVTEEGCEDPADGPAEEGIETSDEGSEKESDAEDLLEDEDESTGATDDVEVATEEKQAE